MREGGRDGGKEREGNLLGEEREGGRRGGKGREGKGRGGIKGKRK